MNVSVRISQTFTVQTGDPDRPVSILVFQEGKLRKFCSWEKKKGGVVLAFFTFHLTTPYSQNVTDDTDAPHVSGVGHRFVVDHFRCHKLRSSLHHLQRRVALCC